MAKKANVEIKMVERQIEVLGGHESHNLMDFHQLLQDALEKLPPEQAATAKFRIDMVRRPYEEDAYPYLHMVYRRPENEEEKTTRLAHEEKMRAWHEDRDKRDYERLSQKFGKNK